MTRVGLPHLPGIEPQVAQDAVGVTQLHVTPLQGLGLRRAQGDDGLGVRVVTGM